MRARSIPCALAMLLLAGSTMGCHGRDGAEPKAPTPASADEAAEKRATAEPAPPEAEPTDAKSQLVARLVGDWHVDLASLDNDPQFAKLPAQQRMQALAMARQMVADVSYSFSADGAIRLGFGPTGRVGTYTVDAVEGHALHITTKTRSGEEETVEKAILRIEGDAMWVTEGPDSRTIRLLRGKPEIAASQPTSQPAAGGPASQPTARGPASQPAAGGPASQPAPASQPKMPAPHPAK